MWYILDAENKPVQATMQEHVQWQRDYPNRDILKHSYFKDKEMGLNIQVSTVFLGLNHEFSITPSNPVVFETMIFDQNNNAPEELKMVTNGYQERYSDYNEAMKGHRQVARLVKALIAKYSKEFERQRPKPLLYCKPKRKIDLHE